MSRFSRLGAPGSARHSTVVLCVAAVAAEAVLALTDGLTAAATGLAVLTVAGLAAARYVSGADAQDNGLRKSVRLLGSRAPALGEWQRIVDRALDADGDVEEAPFAGPLRPQLQRLFAARLAERHGVLLHRSPERARALIGAELWPWIDPARTAPPRTTDPRSVLAALLDRLETL